MKTLANNYRRFGLRVLASLLVPMVQENKTRLSATVQAAGESLQWVHRTSQTLRPPRWCSTRWWPKWDKAFLYGGTTPTGISGAVYALAGLQRKAPERKLIQLMGTPPQPRWGAMMQEG